MVPPIITIKPQVKSRQDFLLMCVYDDSSLFRNTGVNTSNVHLNTKSLKPRLKNTEKTITKMSEIPIG